MTRFSRVRPDRRPPRRERRVDRRGTAVDRLDHVLFYGKAGAGWVGNNNVTVTDLSTGVSLTCGNFTSCGSNNAGWLVGAGVEWMFVPHWSLFVEYNYMGFGTRSSSFLGCGLATCGVFSAKANIQDVLVGVNYKY